MYLFNPLAVGNLAQKHLLNLPVVAQVSGYYLGKKNQNCPKWCLQVNHIAAFFSSCYQVCTESKLSTWR